jgi:hypothetical protein
VHAPLHLLVTKFTAGSLALGGGRYELEITAERTLDGSSSTQFPPIVTHVRGGYDESLAAPIIRTEYGELTAEFQEGGSVVVLSDTGGSFSFSTFRFERF